MDSFGTDEAIHRLVERYSPMLLRLACTRLDSTADAEDTVQEVFLKLLTSRPAFRDEQPGQAWLIRPTLPRARAPRRQAERRNVALDETVTGTDAPPEGESLLLSAVQALPATYSSVIHLYYYEGYSIKEIAHLLGLPAATVGTRLARGRDRLRQLLKEED